METFGNDKKIVTSQEGRWCRTDGKFLIQENVLSWAIW